MPPCNHHTHTHTCLLEKCWKSPLPCKKVPRNLNQKNYLRVGLSLNASAAKLQDSFNLYVNDIKYYPISMVLLIRTEDYYYFHSFMQYYKKDLVELHAQQQIISILKWHFQNPKDSRITSFKITDQLLQLCIVTKKSLQVYLSEWEMEQKVLFIKICLENLLLL